MGNRAPECKMYPMSPYIDGSMYVDTSCPGIGTEGEYLCDENGFNNKYYHKRIENITEKLRDTYEMMEHLKGGLVKECYVKDMPLYKYIGDVDNKYIKMHKESLIHLDCDRV